MRFRPPISGWCNHANSGQERLGAVWIVKGMAACKLNHDRHLGLSVADPFQFPTGSSSITRTGLWVPHYGVAENSWCDWTKELPQCMMDALDPSLSDKSPIWVSVLIFSPAPTKATKLWQSIEESSCFKHYSLGFWLWVFGAFYGASSHVQSWTMFQVLHLHHSGQVRVTIEFPTSYSASHLYRETQGSLTDLYNAKAWNFHQKIMETCSSSLWSSTYI